MPKSPHLSLQDKMRLDAIAEHLRLTAQPGDREFTQQALKACLDRVHPILNRTDWCSGEAIVARLAAAHSLRFEEVREPGDIIALETKYLHEKREIGFGQLSKELSAPGVDALLFQRITAHEHEADRWVAVLNLQESESRGYWNRTHELSHRLAEPPQQILPFRRHRNETTNPVERLIDTIAGEIAFYRPAYEPLVLDASNNHELTFDLVEHLRQLYAPSASLQAVANATVKCWPRPALNLTAAIRGRKGRPHKDKALRVSPQARNAPAHEVGLNVFKNMRPSRTSPISSSYIESRNITDFEELGMWTTSNGSSLMNIRVLTSTRHLGNVVYGIISIAS